MLSGGGSFVRAANAFAGLKLTGPQQMFIANVCVFVFLGHVHGACSRSMGGTQRWT